ncbi:hypothetical protein AB0I10_00300 [Streptomyces sp. NPDC050636]|uniref:hypothetical protein n=1 Tax=Streptomyces sp. NPDC050636 TaxID=3154510 RepID=UPI003416E773
MALHDVDDADVNRLRTHLKVLAGVAPLLDVVVDLGTVRWLLGLVDQNGVLAAHHARMVLIDLGDDGKDGA